mmetsp:Transcript_30137/g.64610  ORF Transcript_30137/g.64610 Transcript_30137/m.64610 type:complete len:288 (+) Transcript_30137:1444-2307(+)
MSLAVMRPSTFWSSDRIGRHLMPSFAMRLRHIPIVSEGRAYMTCEIGVMKSPTTLSMISESSVPPSFRPAAMMRRMSLDVKSPTTLWLSVLSASITIIPDRPPSMVVLTASRTVVSWCITGFNQRKACLLSSTSRIGMSFTLRRLSSNSFGSSAVVDADDRAVVSSPESPSTTSDSCATSVVAGDEKKPRRSWRCLGFEVSCCGGSCESIAIGTVDDKGRLCNGDCIQRDDPLLSVSVKAVVLLPTLEGARIPCSRVLARMTRLEIMGGALVLFVLCCERVFSCLLD